MSDKEVSTKQENVNLDDFLFHISVLKGVMATGPEGIEETWKEERTKLLKSVLASNPSPAIRAQVETELKGDDSNKIDLYPLNFQADSLTFAHSIYNPSSRSCLKCGETFWSMHSGHRLCPACDIKMRH